MSTRLFPWVLRVGWVALAFAAGPALASALHRHDHVRLAASVGLWAAWGAVLLAILVPLPVSLTIIRTATPAAAAAVLAAAVEGHPSSAAIALGLASALAVAAVSFLPATAMVCVNGPAYASERRYPLAVPAPLLLPVALAWAALVGLPSGALLLLAARHWIAGGLLLALAVPAAPLLGRALHGLSRRWVVFVPAGIVLHDPLSLREPVLFRRQTIDRLGPAPADSDALDLTQRAAGLALELVLTEKVALARITPGHRAGEEGASARLLFTPSRPGAVLADARRRRIPVAVPA